MARPRHAMRVHPLRSKGVVVGVPVAAAVAFGAHSVLGVTPLSDQQDVPATAAPSATPLQSYGLATTPPPATLDLLSAPGDASPAVGSAPTTGTSSSSSSSTPSSAIGSTTTKIVGAKPAAAPVQTVPIAAPAPASAPSMMTFSGGDAPQARTAPAAAPQQAAPQEQAAPAQQASDDDGGSQRSGGGALLGLDLGVAKVSVLSFGG